MTLFFLLVCESIFEHFVNNIPYRIKSYREYCFVTNDEYVKIVHFQNQFDLELLEYKYW